MKSLWSNTLGHHQVKERLEELAASERIPPVLLFAGPSGVGKKSLALGLLQRLNCESSSEEKSSAGSKPCGRCPSCLRIFQEQSEALCKISPDGAQIKIDQARQALEFLSLRSLSPWRMVLIDEAERLNPQAANSLLKAFEEPAPKTFFALIVPSYASVLPTIRSRAQVIRVGSLSPSEMKEINSELTDWQVRSCQGRLDQAERLQSESVMELRKEVAQFLNESVGKNTELAIEALKKLGRDRESVRVVHSFLREFVRDAYFASQGLSPLIHEDLQGDLAALYSAPPDQLIFLSEQVQKMEGLFAVNIDSQILFEDFARNEMD